MSSATVLRYELKRSLVSKENGLLMLLLLAYAVYTLKTTVLPGYAGTAPSSAWTFASYLLAACPVLSMIVLFHVSRLSSPYERDAARITSATPGAGSGYVLLRLLVVSAGWLAAVTAVAMVGVAFLVIVFGEIRPLAYLACMALMVLPPFALFLGLGLWAGKVHHNLPLALIVLAFAARLLPPGSSFFLDVLGGSILRNADRAIPVAGEIAFALPPGYLLSRMVLAAIGVALAITGAPRFHARGRGRGASARSAHMPPALPPPRDLAIPNQRP
jgi:hypothetical protein